MTATTIEAPTITAQQLADQIVTALEGGSNYWLERFTSKRGKERATEGPWYSDPKVWDGDFEIEVLADEDSATHSFTSGQGEGRPGVADEEPSPPRRRDHRRDR
ncbi:UNVERIFIED_ORG: hypothetical protein M2193_000084 [Bradyrhizobium japonicum]